jgi:hypothetical protein
MCTTLGLILLKFPVTSSKQCVTDRVRHGPPVLVIQPVRASCGELRTTQVTFISSALCSYRSAVHAQQASRARFAVGMGDIISVMQTIQQLSQAAEQHSSATLSYNNALAQMYRTSANWTGQAEPELHKRLQLLRNNPAAAVKP